MSFVTLSAFLYRCFKAVLFQDGILPEQKFIIQSNSVSMDIKGAVGNVRINRVFVLSRLHLETT